MIWRPSYHTRIVQFADFITTVLGFILAYFLWDFLYIQYRNVLPHSFKITNYHLLLLVILSIINVMLFSYYKAYSYQRFKSLLTEYIVIIKVTTTGFLLSVFIIFMLKEAEMPRTILIVSYLIIFFLYLVQKTILYYVVYYLRRKGKNMKRILLVGTDHKAKEFIETVNKNFGWGLDIVGTLTNDINNLNKEFYGIKVIDTIDNLGRILKSVNPEEIIIAISSKNFEIIRNVIEVCEREGVMVRLNSDFFGHITKNVTVDNVFGQNIISFNMVEQSEIELFIKRLIDLIGAAILIIFFSPFMLLSILGIFIFDGRPVFYSFTGYGLNKKPLKIVKLRTMVQNAQELKKGLLDKNEMIGPVFKIKEDPRITTLGKILRKFSIDETPQLFSVFKGDMSLVGPRQAMKEELDAYESWQRRRLSVKPGLTCLWQVNGRHNINDFQEWMKLDLFYIDNWSLWLDIKILIKTIPVILFGRGV